MILTEIVSQIDPAIHKNNPNLSLKQKYRLSVLAQRERDKRNELELQKADLERKRNLLVQKVRYLSGDAEYWHSRWEREQTRTARKALKKASKREEAIWSEIGDIDERLTDLKDEIEYRGHEIDRFLGVGQDPMPPYT